MSSGQETWTTKFEIEAFEMEVKVDWPAVQISLMRVLVMFGINTGQLQHWFQNQFHYQNRLTASYKSALKGNILHQHAQFLHVAWLNECKEGEKVLKVKIFLIICYLNKLGNCTNMCVLSHWALHYCPLWTVSALNSIPHHSTSSLTTNQENIAKLRHGAWCCCEIKELKKK